MSKENLYIAINKINTKLIIVTNNKGNCAMFNGYVLADYQH